MVGPTLVKKMPCLASPRLCLPTRREQTLGCCFFLHSSESLWVTLQSMASSQPSVNRENQEEDDSFLRAQTLVNLPWITMALDTVWDAGVFDVLAEATGGEEIKLSAKGIAARLQIKNPTAPAMLDRLLKLLACYGVVGCSLGPADDERRLYTLNSVSRCFVPDQSGFSLRSIQGLNRKEAFGAAMGEFKNAIVEGGNPFNRAHKMSFYEYNKKDQRFNQVFNESIRARTTFTMNVILENYHGLKDLSSVVDVGGGLGITLGIITSKYPYLKGINFDLPHVVHEAPSYLGVKHIGGDMFESVPEGDAIFLKSVMHNWDDGHCIKLLKNCHNSIPKGGKLIIVERIPPIFPDASEFTKDSYIIDVAMATLFNGGQERSVEQYKALASKAGFSKMISFQKFATCGFCIMEFLK